MMPQEIHRYRRFKGWDYSRGASLFITIGVQPRRRLFREVVRRMERAVDKGYVAPFARNRYLEIARGNDETEFGRAACLDLNAEIIEIATAGEGLALYLKGNDA